MYPLLLGGFPSKEVQDPSLGYKLELSTLFVDTFYVLGPRPDSAMVERSPGMREIDDSIPDMSSKTLQVEVLLFCFQFCSLYFHLF